MVMKKKKQKIKKRFVYMITVYDVRSNNDSVHVDCWS